MSGSVEPTIYRAQRLVRLASTRRLGISISLRVRDQAALTRFLHAVSDTSSAAYRHFLTPRQFAERFGPTAASIGAVRGWLAGHGFTGLQTSANGLQISARGSVGEIQSTFHTPMFTYRTGTRTFFANSTSVQVPAAIAPSVVAVTGLKSSFPQQSSMALHARTNQTARGYSAADMQSIYNVSPLLDQGINGKGQTVAIATFGGYSDSDIATFDAQNGVGGSVTSVAVDGGASLGSNNGQDETEIDVEIIQSMAPASSIVVYEAPNSNVSNQTTIDMYNRIVSDDRASIVATSWGTAESQVTSADIAAMDQILQEAAAQGQSFLAASGDQGAYDGAGTNAGSDSSLEVDFPASDPWVTGVGGTILQTNGSRYVGETAWSDAQSPQGAAGSGGGLSAKFSRPAYQTGPGVDNQYSNGQRQVPDVAANADPNTGYALYTVNSKDVATWLVGGGTSASAPLWAGFIALVNQASATRAGFLNPRLYQLGRLESTFGQAPFHDITSGNNLYYPATAGWDFATGWGSFNGAAFVSDWKSLPALPVATSTVPTATPRPTATTRPTATPRPTSTPRPVPTPTMSSLPFVTITRVVLLHRVKGMLIPTSSLKISETGTLMILYQSKNVGSLKKEGTVTVRKGALVLKQVLLKSTKYKGRAALTAIIRFTAKNRVGTLVTHVAVVVGSVRTVADRTFKLAL